MTLRIHSMGQAKARARIIRARHAANNQTISHSAALEQVASEQGCANWNTLAALLSNAPDILLQVGDRVEGVYLKKSFNGTVHAVRTITDGAAFEVSIRFDEPVDVVEFDSFSNFRQRVQAVISPEGVSFARTSDRIPHLVLSRTLAMAI